MILYYGRYCMLVVPISGKKVSSLTMRDIIQIVSKSVSATTVLVLYRP